MPETSICETAYCDKSGMRINLPVHNARLRLWAMASKSLCKILLYIVYKVMFEIEDNGDEQAVGDNLRTSK